MTRSGKVTWRSPSNIALVKYWGKKEGNLPAGPSVSLTLNASFTETTVEYAYEDSRKSADVQFTFEGGESPYFSERVKNFIAAAAKAIPVINHLRLKIESSNSFPHSAGIASSASSVSSIALCLCTIRERLEDVKPDPSKFYADASFLARLGSGSACRSVFGSWALWGKMEEIAHSSDKRAIPIDHLVHPRLRMLYDAILVVSSARKDVPSREGHRLMGLNPYKEIRYDQARANALEIIRVLQSGDEKSFAGIVESEAASLHAMMLTSHPPVLLIRPATLQVIEKLLDFRKDSGLPFAFTLDAGPNVHVLYPEQCRDKMLKFIQNELVVYCENGMWLDDKAGSGPAYIPQMDE